MATRNRKMRGLQLATMRLGGELSWASLGEWGSGNEPWKVWTPAYKTKHGAKRALERIADKLGFDVRWEDD